MADYRIPHDPAPTRRRIWPWLVSGGLAVFLIGLIGSPWFEARVRSQLPAALQASDAPRTEAELAALSARVARLESQASAQLPGPRGAGAAAQPAEARIAALEAALAARNSGAEALGSSVAALDQQVDQIEAAVSAGDSQLRALFLLAVARRMLEAGRPLTPIAPQLEAGFRAGDPAAVDALLAWSREPQTPATLKARLPELSQAAARAAAAPETGWWEQLKAKLSGLVTVRGETGAAAPDLAQAVGAAREAVAEGDLQRAVTALESGPRVPAVLQWTHDARLWLDAEAALSRLDGEALDQAVAHLRADQPAQPVPQALNAR